MGEGEGHCEQVLPPSEKNNIKYKVFLEELNMS